MVNKINNVKRFITDDRRKQQIGVEYKFASSYISPKTCGVIFIMNLLEKIIQTQCLAYRVWSETI